MYSPYLSAVVPLKGFGAIGLPAVHAPRVLMCSYESMSRGKRRDGGRAGGLEKEYY